VSGGLLLHPDQTTGFANNAAGEANRPGIGLGLKVSRAPASDEIALWTSTRPYRGLRGSLSQAACRVRAGGLG